MDLEVPAQADTTAACKDVSVTGAQSIAFADNLENVETRRSAWRPQSLLLRAPCDKLMVQCWHKLEVFAGSRGSLQQLREPRDRSAKEWTKGVNTAGSTRLLRVLLPVRSFLEMLRVDISVRSDMGSIVAPHARLSDQQVLFLYKGGHVAKDLKSLDTEAVRFKVIELQLNFDAKMERIQLMPLPCRGFDNTKFRNQRMEYNKLFEYVVKAEKTRQMNIEEESAWPQRLPWGVPKDVNSMPIGIWMKKADKQ